MHPDPVLRASDVLMAFLLASNALAFQVGTPSVVHHPVSRATPAVTMAIPWRLAGAVTVAGGAATGVTFAVKTVLKKQASNEAEMNRKALAGLTADLPSGDLLDKDVEDPFVILGSEHGLNTAGAAAATEADPTLALASQAIGR